MKENKSLQAVHELGGLPSLLELLKSDFPVIQHLALKTLKCVTVDKVAQQTFRKEQGLEKLMNLLDNKVSIKYFEKYSHSLNYSAFNHLKPQCIILREKDRPTQNSALFSHKRNKFYM